VLARPDDLATATGLVVRAAGGPEVEPEVEPDVGRISVPVTERVTALAEVLRALGDAGIEVADVGLRRPTLDDVFLRLTGHRATPTTTDETDETDDAPETATTEEAA
jgi:ABC-2 type transport system ATP-binding protein